MKADKCGAFISVLQETITLSIFRKEMNQRNTVLTEK